MQALWSFPQHTKTVQVMCRARACGHLVALQHELHCKPVSVALLVTLM